MARTLRSRKLFSYKIFTFSDFFPRTFSPKFSPLLFKLSKSDFGNHFIPATVTDLSSLPRRSVGYDPENVIPFDRKPPLLSTISKLSVTSLASLIIFRHSDRRPHTCPFELFHFVWDIYL